MTPLPEIKPATTDDRAAIARRIDEITGEARSLIVKTAGVYTAASLGIIAAGMSLTGAVAGSEPAAWILAPIPVAAAILGVVAGRKKAFTTFSDRIAGLENAVAKGKVLVTRHTTSAAMQVNDRNDSVPAFLMQVGPGDVIFLKGDYLLDDAAEECFPSAAFDLIQVPGSPEIVAVHCAGGSMTDVRELNLRSGESIDGEDGQMLHGDLAEPARFKRQRRESSNWRARRVVPQLARS